MTLSGPVGGTKKRRHGAAAAASSKRRRGGDNDEGDGGGNDGTGDLADMLLAAVNGGSSERSKGVRRDLKNAVAYQYKSSQDVARLAATYARQYTITDVPGGRALASGAAIVSRMTVTYPKSVGSSLSSLSGSGSGSGSGSRAMYEETVDVIDLPVLRATLQVPLDDTTPGGMREHLKPVNLARGSPRLFWSLVRLFGPDVAAGLRQLFPEVC